MHAFLTTREVADLLRLKERKIYDLAGSGDIPCVRVTGKLLFPRTMIEAWLMQNVEFGGGVDQLTPHPDICVGSHDPLLEWALREADTGLAVNFGGSLDGLERMQKGEAVLAGIHLREDGEGDAAYNIANTQHYLGGQPVVLIEWARRQQGLIVAAGNPFDLHTVTDLKGRTIIGRQHKAGSFLLLQNLVESAGMSLGDLNFFPSEARTENDVAATVADGQADVGLGIATVARQYRLDFIPLTEERFDLVIWRPGYFERPIQALLEFAATDRFKKKAAALDYDVTGLGRVHYNAL
ncbi:MAG: helix-turn-helix transcriptional regulator [Fimbriimonadaceae bacterium]|nr:helix-turn-helix transcriptional regulator [Alphaproteobacteria bacterium]